uniref:Exosome complex exonuclease (Rrp46 homologue), putative n=1 Tax=Theileria annulata TaxID=5874 RepID=A0A3B0N4M7_THEAN
MCDSTVYIMINFKRIDDRTNYSLRPVSFKLNPLKTGPSCKISVGNVRDDKGNLTGIGGRTTVIAILMFSSETKSKNAPGSFHKPHMEVFVRPASGTIKSSLRSIESILLKIMQRLIKVDRLGKVTLSLRLQIMEDSGGLLSVCINTLILCLYLSGIDMINVPYSVSVGIVRAGSDSMVEDLVILDPTDYEIATYWEVSLITIDSGSGLYGNSLTQIKSLAKKAAVKYMEEVEKLKNQSSKSL